jgi:predicted rRNA methylase YqxC with S4 and FtsJ domains
VHKALRKEPRVYLLDSTNLQHLSRDDVSGVIMDFVKAKIKQGLKVTEKWIVQTTIQSYYDLRFFLAKLI